MITRDHPLIVQQPNDALCATKKGQLDFVLNAIHDDIEFISYSPIKVFPFLGHRRGKPAMSEALHGAVEAFEFVAASRSPW